MGIGIGDRASPIVTAAGKPRQGRRGGGVPNRDRGWKAAAGASPNPGLRLVMRYLDQVCSVNSVELQSTGGSHTSMT
eukprot:350659-Chlamydomonas_euryale.AAC.6